MTYSTELYHYSSNPEITLTDSYYDKLRAHCRETGDIFKPIGLWISVEDKDSYNWKDWCCAESFNLGNLRYKFQVKLNSEANILTLSTVKDILDFSHEYALNDPEDYRAFTQNFISDPYIYRINWTRLSDDYDGIIISPYQWTLRLHQTTTWYYPWDCASGCIWNMKIIDGLEMIEETPEFKDLPKEIDKEALLKLINEKFSFNKDGNAVAR